MEESCFPYAGKDTPCGVPRNCLRHYAAEYSYVGGVYGGCSESAMMLELVKNGPMGVAFEVCTPACTFPTLIGVHLIYTPLTYQPPLRPSSNRRAAQPQR